MGEAKIKFRKRKRKRKRENEKEKREQTDGRYTAIKEELRRREKGEKRGKRGGKEGEKEGGKGRIRISPQTAVAVCLTGFLWQQTAS